ncbi:oligosaccharide flippase family protein [Vibrio jasicida]|uniref:oligosaccharide flippase family protein n=1 Tax=Vibrio jasicida TaxID=766224 RepID=UPI00148CA861|nr:oligosaccharide flippase family protein [Vibrio jasicida]NOJ19279.1 oligosaccharide flippase family protein [Vibrio jasicida]
MLQSINQKLQNLPSDKKQFFSLGAATAIVKALAAFFAFLLTLVVSRYSNTTTAGQFFYLFNLVSLVAIIAQLGFNISLVKFNAIAFKNQNRHEQSNNYRIALARSLLFCVAVCSLLYLAITTFPEPLNTTQASNFSLALAIIAIPLLVIGQTNSRVLQASRKVITSLIALQLGVSFLMVALIIFAKDVYPISTDVLMVLFLVATTVVAIHSTLKWLRSGEYQHGSTKHNPELTYSANQVWVGSIFTNLVQWGSLVIAGFFISTSDLGLLAAAQRTSLLIGFVLVTINFVVAPMFASLYKEGKMDRLRNLSRLACRANIGAAILPVIICVLFPEFIMQLFGKEFIAAAPLLLALSLGQLINVATGSVGFLLLMSGHEKTMKYITIVSGVISIALLILLSNGYGVLGAAWAMAIGLAIQNLAALYFVKRHLGFFPVG